MNKSPYPEVGPGWWHMLDDYLSQIRAIDPDCDVIVKEKFGLLRIRPYEFKGGLSWKDFRAICMEAENASETVCELCGEHGRLRTDRSWWETLCDRCAALNETERRKVEQETAEKYFRGSHARHGEPQGRGEVREKKLKDFLEAQEVDAR